MLPSTRSLLALLLLLVASLRPGSVGADEAVAPAPAPTPGTPVTPVTPVAPLVPEVDPALRWSQALLPAPGPALAIGGYSAGCLQGAQKLSLKGRGFRVMRPERNRIFGHPLLVAFIGDLGRALAKKRLSVLPVGDLGQARGGPAPTGHASHQSGLDVDLWYAQDRARGKKPPQALSLVDGKTQKVTKAFKPAIVKMLTLAAGDARVERIFVNPILKRELCRAPEAKRAWLHKVRPWWGHADHFHVRLACPVDSPECEPQAPLPDGDGCKDLEWWFRTDVKDERQKKQQDYQAKVGARPPLPATCAALLP